MKKLDTIEDEIDRIRLNIYEKTKNMTIAQRVQHTNKSAEAVVARYGYKFVPSTRHKGCHMMVRDKRKYGFKITSSASPHSPTAKRQEVLV